MDLSNTNYGNLSDSVLAGLSKKGDERAFEEITIRYIKLICSIASKYRADGYETQDFVQEGLLAFLIAGKTYDEDYGMSFKNYAVRCAKNRFTDIVKKSNSKSAVPESKLVPMESISGKSDDRQNVEEYVLEKEYLKTLTRHINSILSADEREIFTMYATGYSYKDIALKMGTTAKSVDNTLQKIKRKLRA